MTQRESTKQREHERVLRLLDTRRFCYYVPESQDPATYGGYVPSLVIEGESGHFPMLGNGPGAAPWVWGATLEGAQEVAAAYNARRGLTPVEVTEIIASSMGVSRIRASMTARHQATLANLKGEA